MLYAHNIVDDADMAEDLVQNAFLSLWENRDDFEQETTVRSFLYLSVRRRAIDHLRHAKVEGKYRLSVQSESKDMELAIDEDEDILDNEVYHRLFEAINELPDRQRELFLFYMQGKKNGEIAKAMNIAEETVRVQKKRALKSLRKKMGNRGDLHLLLLLLC